MTALVATLAVASLSGRVLDRTTGQPLAHVGVTAGTHHATTDAKGAFVLRDLAAGNVTLTLESDDVPAQQVTVKLRPGKSQHDVRACSTTLDYDCGAPRSGGGGAG